MPQKVLNVTQLDAGNSSGQVPTYITGTWTPTFTGLTEVAWTGTKVGRYTRIGNIVTFQIVITTTAGTTAAVAGTTYCDLPVTASQHGNITASNLGTLLGIGGGLLNATTDRGYVPTWAATGDNIVISGTYEA